MAAKRTELLKNGTQHKARCAVIFNPQHFDDEVTLERRRAKSLFWHRANNPPDKQRRRSRCGAAGGECGSARMAPVHHLVAIDGVVAGRIAQYGQERRLAVIASWRKFVDSGALLSYGPR